MAETTKIQWCDATYNHIRGCTKVSPGCANCYAETLAGRNPSVLGVWGPKGTRVVATEDYWRQPLKWDREAHKAGERRRVFCASLADVFEEWDGPIENSYGVQVWKRGDGSWTTSDHYGDTVALRMDDVRGRLFALAALTPNLDWLFLTKRADLMRRTIGSLCDGAAPHFRARVYRAASRLFDSGAFSRTTDAHGEQIHAVLGGLPHADAWPLPNWWLGVSVEDQQRADERIPLLLDTPAAVRFLSVEPLLGPVELMPTWTHTALPCPDGLPGCEVLHTGPSPLHWVIVGGESGAGARPCDVEWVRSIVRQCQAADLSCFVKQLGSNVERDPHPVREDYEGAGRRLRLIDKKGGDPAEWAEDLRIRQFPRTSQES